MSDIQTYFESLRDSVRARLPDKTFLKLDRGDALLITNAIFTETLPGFSVTRRGALTILAPDIETITAFETLFDPLGDLSGSLLRFRGSEPAHEVIPLFSEGLKQLQLSSPSLRKAYDKNVRRYIAASLREKRFGGLYAIALINDCLNTDMEETV